MSITRRDFLNGVALTVAAGLTPAAQLAAQPRRYPPALIGLRGQHEGSFETAHALAREGRRFDFDGLPIDGALRPGRGRRRHQRACRRRGSTAASIRRRASSSSTTTTISAATPSATSSRIDGRRIIGYGGSQSFQSPNSLYGPAAKGLLRELGVDIKRFETAFDRELYPSLGLSRGMFFARETFGRDALVTGDPPQPECRRDYAPAEQRQAAARSSSRIFRFRQESKAQYLALYATRARSARRPSRRREARAPQDAPAIATT